MVVSARLSLSSAVWSCGEQTEKFPLDAKTSSGDKFWSGTKRFPAAIDYDPANEYHVMFVTSVANILAGVFATWRLDSSFLARLRHSCAVAMVFVAAAFGIVPPPPHFLSADHAWRTPEFVNGVISKLPVPARRAVSVTLDDAPGAPPPCPVCSTCAVCIASPPCVTMRCSCGGEGGRGGGGDQGHGRCRGARAAGGGA